MLAFLVYGVSLVNSYRSLRPPRIFSVTLLALSFAFAAPLCARAQTPAQPPAAQPSPEQPDAEAGEASAAETDAAQKRLARARSLAAIGKLAAAASELDALHSSTRDESVRDVTRILLMAIFVEMPDYARAASLLDEAFDARARGENADAATHAYFALAGQAVNSVRTHLERYRSFGINVSDASELPPEANGDLEQLRNLLEHIATQAKTLHDEQAKGGDAGTRGLDAAALLEDAATVRMRIARHEQDHAQWQAVVSEARQHLFSSDMRIASISEIPAARPAPVATQPAAKAPASAAAQPRPAPARGEQKADASAQKSSKKRQQQKQQSGTNANAAAATATAAPGDAQAPRQAAGAPQPPAGGAKVGGGSPVAVGSLASKAKQKISPTYPTIAKAGRVTGIVTVYLVVNEKGEVETVQRLEGPLQLQQAAAEAARRWRFNPTVIDGQPVRVTGYLSFNFAL
jgi:TonB family protein